MVLGGAGKIFETPARTGLNFAGVGWEQTKNFNLRKTNVYSGIRHQQLCQFNQICCIT